MISLRKFSSSRSCRETRGNKGKQGDGNKGTVLLFLAKQKDRPLVHPIVSVPLFFPKIAGYCYFRAVMLLF